MIGLAVALVFVLPALAQDSREETREHVRRALNKAGKLEDVNVQFHQSDKQEFNFVGTATGLPNAESLEIVIRVTENDTVNVRVYPHYKGGYINLDHVKSAPALMKKILAYNDSNFLFWGADDERDLFAGYNFTLESGFPEEALVIVLRSVRNTDKFVGELRPLIDGSKGIVTED